MDLMREVQIHNSLTGRKEPLRPLIAGAVGMYVCGMTVYDSIHVGHARMAIVFDTVRRYLRAVGYRVTFVQNITDIDDKIITRAAENNEPIVALTARQIVALHEDFAALGIERPDHEPRATAFIAQMVNMIARLVEREYAYVATDGDVMYAVRRFAPYGKLSGKKLDDLRAGARIELDTAKRDPLDFVLWKISKPGEPSWDSPWGKGRPGWHIECSAMSTAILGSHFDIHGGGMDLKFPHHENEIAQSCAALDTPFVNVWMHNGFVNVNDEKMSKSLGNFFTVRDILPLVRPEVLRYFVISSHYRGPINYTEANLAQADAALERLYLALRGVPAGGPASLPDAFHTAMTDDFNTPEALAVVQALARDLNSAKSAGDGARAAGLAAQMRACGSILGVLTLDAEEYLRRPPSLAGRSDADAALTDVAIATLIAERTAARKARNFKESDRIRDELASAGVMLEDGPQGTTWRRG
jgi:cysteinyl-tRNA synthetase